MLNNGNQIEFKIGKTWYENSLSCRADIKETVIESSKESQPVITFENDCIRLESDVNFLL